MNFKKIISGAVVISTLGSVPYIAFANPSNINDTSMKNVDSEQTKASMNFAKDNSGRNTRDATNKTVTPLDQSNDQKDLNVTAAIRKSLINSEGLSTNAKNIKVITTSDGHVTLRGIVDSSNERDTIYKIALRSAEGHTVKNLLEVKQ